MALQNTLAFQSAKPDRYPLNPNTALVVNVGVGWLFYVAAAVFGDHVVWLGMASAIALFLPLAVAFFDSVVKIHSASTGDWLIGVALGLVLNYVGILKLIDWLKDENTPYVFPARGSNPNRRAKPIGGVQGAHRELLRGTIP